MIPSFAVPPKGFGPGSMTQDSEEDLQYLAMPSGVSVYTPHLPELDDINAARPAIAFLEALRDTMAHWRAGQSVIVRPEGLDPGNRRIVDDSLGEGEVSIVLEDTAGRIEVQETVFAGLWSMRAFSRTAAKGAVPRGQMEVAAFPRVVLARAFPPVRAVPDITSACGEGVVNAPAILTELLDKSAAWQPGTPPHVVNLSLLPHTPEDLDMIERVLGHGTLTILSRGYGNCRITSTATPHVWRVRYFNSMDTLILDTIEVTEVPEVACAAQEDLADSAERLGEICAIIAEPAP
ncbi:MAG: hydrogenase expression/formation protein [Acetobacter papayae]